MASLDRQIDQELPTATGTPTTKSKGKTVSFPIGSTAQIAVGQERYLLFALARADHANCKADADVTMMWVALHKLWERARYTCNGHPLNVPLVGAGLSNIGLPPRDLLNLIILSLITETKAKQITQLIRIMLHIGIYDDLDLRTVKQHWEER